VRCPPWIDSPRFALPPPFTTFVCVITIMFLQNTDRCCISTKEIVCLYIEALIPLDASFSNMTVCCRLFRHPSLSAARSDAIHVVLTLWLTPETFGLFYFVLWGLLGAPKCDPSKIEEGGVLRPLTATINIINSTTN
jgi:hypothetical protein